MLTVVTPTIEGRTDDDHPTLVYKGRLSKAQCERVARDYAKDYPRVALVRTEDGCFLATYSNEDVEPEDPEFGYTEEDDAYCGDLTLHFRHVKLTPLAVSD